MSYQEELARLQLEDRKKKAAEDAEAKKSAEAKETTPWYIQFFFGFVVGLIFFASCIKACSPYSG